VPVSTATREYRKNGTDFSTRSVLRCYKQNQLATVVRELLRLSRCESCRCEKLVAEAENRTGTKRKGNVRRWKPIPSNCTEDVTVNTSMCVCARECV
jgi:hypothetical protein